MDAILTRIVVCSLCLFCADQAYSQQTAQSVKPDAVPKVRAISLRPGGTSYPVDLAALGVQGTAEVLAKLDPGYKVSDATIAATSRSNQLDDLAVQLVQRAAFKPSSTDGPRIEAIIVPVEFLRDSVNTLPQKSCDEFNVDLKYFRATFPEKDPEADMTVINMARGLLVLAASNASAERKLELVRAIKLALPKAIAECKDNPGAKFMQTLTQEVKAASK